jgi:hypothetical protein
MSAVMLNIFSDTLPRLGHVFEHDLVRRIACEQRHFQALSCLGTTVFGS